MSVSVRSKTEHAGKPHASSRCSRYSAHLEAAFDQAEEGAEFVFPEEYRRRAEGERGFNGANVRTTFSKIIRRAG